MGATNCQQEVLRIVRGSKRDAGGAQSREQEVGGMRRGSHRGKEACGGDRQRELVQSIDSKRCSGW